MRRTAAGFAVALLVLPATSRAEPPETDALLRLNGEFRKVYARERAAALARGGPVILADGDRLVLFRGKERTEAVVLSLIHI